MWVQLPPVPLRSVTHEGDHAEDDLAQDQRDDHPLQQLRASVRLLVGQLLVHGLQRLELAQCGALPFIEVHAAFGRAVEPGQELVAQQFQRVVQLLVQQRRVHLQFGQALQIAMAATKALGAAP